MLAYIDTSAIAKRLLEEQETEALNRHIAQLLRSGHRVISSALLDVELARLRVREELDPTQIEAALAQVHLVAISPEVIDSAKAIVQPLRSLDAIHVGTALILADEAEGEDAVEQIVTYDAHMRAVAEELGFDVISPGRQ